MDKKLKFKVDKQHNKLRVDYNKVMDKDRVRFEILSKISNRYPCFILINTALDTSKNNYSDYRGFNLYALDDYNDAQTYLNKAGYPYRIAKSKRNVNRLFLGVPSGKIDEVEDISLGVVLNQGELTYEFFKKICCSHDFQLGINFKKDVSELISIIQEKQWNPIVEAEEFEYTLIDSHWMKYFYTNLERSFFE